MLVAVFIVGLPLLLNGSQNRFGERVSWVADPPEHADEWAIDDFRPCAAPILGSWMWVTARPTLERRSQAIYARG